MYSQNREEEILINNLPKEGYLLHIGAPAGPQQWSQMTRIKMVCVEYDNKAPEMTDFMKDNGFALVHRNGENLIFEKNG